MIRLRVLGSVDLSDDVDARDVGQILAQPKRLALLAYLAVAAPHGLQRRDSLLAMFWPELDETRARDALNSAIRFLRRGLGDRVIVSRGSNEIGVDPAFCWCDAAALRKHLAAGEHEAALALYHGDLLAGLHLGATQAFDEWLERERASLRGEASRAATSVSEAAARAGETARAIAYANRACELAPDDERALRHLLDVLDQAGDRVGAVQAYESYARRVAADYDAVPAPETQRVIERIRVRSTAHAPALPNVVADVARPERASVPDEAVAARHGARPHRVPGRLLVAGLVALTGGLLGLGAWLRPSTGALDTGTIAVLPFRVAGPDSSLDYLREGIIDLANAELTGEGLPNAVDARTLLARLRRSSPDQRTDIEPDAAVDLARKVGAAHVLLGEVTGERGSVSASARVLRVRDGRVVARHAENGTNDLEVVRKLLRGVMALAGGEARERLPTLSDSIDAVRAYLAGMASFRAAQYDVSVGQFRRAVGIDSSFALGWLWLSTASQYTGADHLYARIRAWSLRHDLSARDRAYLAAIHEVNPRTSRQKLEAFADAAMQNPARAEVWRMWSIAAAIEGAAAGIDEWQARAEEAADSAIALDSSLAPAIEFRLELALRAHDRAYLERPGRALFAMLPPSPGRDHMRWAIAHELEDSAMVAAIRKTFASGTDWNALEMAGLSTVLGLPMHDAEQIALLRRRAAVPRRAVGTTMLRLREIAGIRGRLDAVRAYSDSIHASGTISWYDHVAPVLLGISEPGLEDVAARAATALEEIADTTRSRATEAIAICHSQLWRIARHDTTRAREAIARLQRAEQSIDPGETWWWVDRLGACSRLLDAALEAEAGFPTRDAYARFEGVMRDGISGPPVALALLMLSKWQEANGDSARALATLRRRIRVSNAYYFLLEPRYLREEGRLAAINNDTAGAIRAFRHFLVLRDRPDPGPVEDEVRSVRAHLAQLSR